MASSSTGAYSGSSGSGSRLQSSSSEEDAQQMTIVDLRKRKRMQSNRESARRSRMKKQQHLDDLTEQMGQLRNENNEILSNMNVTNQLYLSIEAENSILRAQMSELGHRLDSLNEIISYVSFTNGLYEAEEATGPSDTASSAAAASVHYHHHRHQISDDVFMNPWSCTSFHVNQPIMDVVMY